MKIQKGWSLPVVVAVVGLMLLCCQGAQAWPVPDTGQTKCYDNNQEIPCPSPGQDFYGQDGNYTRPRSYTDLGNGIIRDDVSGLMWQKATAPGTYNWQQALDYCAALSFGGYSDWRLPTIKELSTLVDSSIAFPSPVIDLVCFSDTPIGSYYWAAEPWSYDSSFAWLVRFDSGYVGVCGKSANFNIRAVRGGQSSNKFIDNGNGTVSDISTGLMWQKATAPGTYTWKQALAYCDNLPLAGHHDWRLPNRNELQSLGDYSIPYPGPKINITYFPDTVAGCFWSATTNEVYNTAEAWNEDFNSGAVGPGGKSADYYVRAVRNGWFGSFDANGNGIPDIIEYYYGFRGSAGYSADPINTGIGNYVYDHVDLALPGSGMGFEFKRTYNSLNPETGPLGYGWSHSYNISVQEIDSNTVVTWGDGQKYVYSKQADDSYEPVFPGIYVSLRKDAGTGAYSITRKDQAVYDFDTAGRLSSIADRNGNTITLSYDGSGYLTSIDDTAGRTITITNNAGGRIIAIADPMGRTAGFAYDASGDLVSVTDLRGNATTFTYDANHRLLTFVDPLGNTVVSHTYNAKNQVATQADAKGGVTTITYDNETRITTLVDPQGHNTQHFYDANYRLIRGAGWLGQFELLQLRFAG